MATVTRVCISVMTGRLCVCVCVCVCVRSRGHGRAGRAVSVGWSNGLVSSQSRHVCLFVSLCLCLCLGCLQCTHAVPRPAQSTRLAIYVICGSDVTVCVWNVDDGVDRAVDDWGRIPRVRVRLCNRGHWCHQHCCTIITDDKATRNSTHRTLGNTTKQTKTRGRKRITTLL